MNEAQEWQTIFEKDEYEFEEKDWYNFDEWNQYDEVIKSKNFTFIDTDGLIKKLPKNDEIDEVETILSTSSSVKSVNSFKSKSVENPAHSCLHQISGSDAELNFFNLFSLYPIPEDPGLNPAFWILYPNPPVYKPDGIEKFFDIVKLLRLTPIASLRQQLKTEKVNLGFYGIDPEVVQALSEAMLLNLTVKNLDLQENSLTVDSCYHLNRLLLRNTVLSSLNLTDCKIGAQGAKRLEEGISSSSALRELNLSHCELGNKGFYYIAKAVAANTLLKCLNVSYNNLDEGSASYMQKMLIVTESLKSLNISWNDFYTKEASEKLFGGLTHNVTLDDVDLSWNSIGKESTFHICNFVSNSKHVKCLNLTANRLTDTEAVQIAEALLKSRTLQELHLNNNPLGSKGVSEFIKVLNSYELMNCSVLLINLEYFWATKDALPILDQIQEIKPNLVIKLGGILGNYQIIGPDLKSLFFMTANYEAMNCKRKKDRKNFGHFVLSLEDSKISKERFKDLLTDTKIKISETLANEIMNQFLVTKKSLDQAELKRSYISFFPDTKLPIPPPPKVENIEKNDSKDKEKKKASSKKKKGKKK